ncbi:unnamed protein product [Protopolystoma xenopodis]|uniref:Uncharacterized protein n=1 Tax=Protopolystoma xenopodis TaxID=117903 RepID=A0A3S5AJ92_9PLAT|nr:unnamed protein product [Protopolystoma xenopodis]
MSDLADRKDEGSSLQQSCRRDLRSTAATSFLCDFGRQCASDSGARHMLALVMYTCASQSTVLESSRIENCIGLLINGTHGLLTFLQKDLLDPCTRSPHLNLALSLTCEAKLGFEGKKLINLTDIT